MEAPILNLAVTALQASGASPGNDLMQMLIFVGPIFFIVYFMMIRPQVKKQREHEALMKAVDKGDRVVTNGGIHGQVTGATDDVLTLEIANVKGERVRIKVDRGCIERRLEKAKGGDES